MHSLKLVHSFSLSQERDVPESQATSASLSAASNLLQSAQELEQDGQLEAAMLAFRAAAFCSEFLEGRLAFAGFLTRREKLAAAATVYRQVLTELRDKDDLPDAARLTAVATHNLAAICRQTGELNLAATLQQHSLKSELEVGDLATPEDLAGCAVDAIHRGDYSLAENLLLRSLHEETAAGNREGVAADCGNLAILAGLRGDLSVGIRFLGRAFQIHRELSDDLATGTDLVNLAELFRTAGRWTLAERCLNRAKRCFQNASAPTSLRKAQSRLSELRRLFEIQDRDPLLN
jgi:tetratricopeptide (TPR) repeat protein